MTDTTTPPRVRWWAYKCDACQVHGHGPEVADRVVPCWYCGLPDNVILAWVVSTPIAAT